jgi:hypothetical protein
MAVSAILTLLGPDPERGKFKIITTYPAGRMIMGKLYGDENVLSVEIPAQNRNSMRPARAINGALAVLSVRLSAGKILSSYSGHRVHFFSVAFAPVEFWMVKKLSANNKVIYHQIVAKPAGFKKTLSLKTLVYKAAYRILYGMDVEVGYGGGRYITYMPASFYASTVSEEHLWDKPLVIKENAAFLDKLGLDLKGKEILLAPHDSPGNGITGEDEYLKRMDELIKALSKNGLLAKTALKPHPVWRRLYGMEKDISVAAPDYVTSEIIMSSFNCVISYASAALIWAAKSGKHAISLLDYIDPIDPECREIYRRYLDGESNGKICYPKNIDEIISAVGLGCDGRKS